MTQEEIKKAYQILRKYGETKLKHLAEAEEFQKEHETYTKEKTEFFKKVQTVYQFNNEIIKKFYENYSLDDCKAAFNYTEGKNAVNKAGLFTIALRDGYGKRVKVIDASPAVETSYCLIQKMEKEEKQYKWQYQLLIKEFNNIPEEYRVTMTTDAEKEMILGGYHPNFIKAFPQLVMRKVLNAYQRRVSEDVQERDTSSRNRL
jgi:hypothetical protein